MSVFKAFAEEEQRKAADAFQKHLTAVDQSNAELAEFKSSLEPYYSVIKAFLEEQAKGAEGTPFTAAFSADSNPAVPALYLKLNFAFRKSASMRKRTFCYRVVFAKDGPVSAQLLEVPQVSGGLQPLDNVNETPLGPINHIDLQIRIESHLSEMIQFASRLR